MVLYYIHFTGPACSPAVGATTILQASRLFLIIAASDLLNYFGPGNSGFRGSGRPQGRGILFSRGEGQRSVSRAPGAGQISKIDFSGSGGVVVFLLSPEINQCQSPKAIGFLQGVRVGAVPTWVEYDWSWLRSDMLFCGHSPGNLWPGFIWLWDQFRSQIDDFRSDS